MRENAMKPLIPKALRRGDTIALVAPAGPVDPSKIERAIAAYEQWGFRIKTYRDIHATHGYLAGDDLSRATELMQAFADPEVSAVFPARGGTGVTRLLDRLDYELIRNNPKLLAGFSDITALHLAVYSQTGLVTFHSPHPMDGPGHPEGFTELTQRTYWRCLLADEYNSSGDQSWQLPLTKAEADRIVTKHPGTARGLLTGGNLALICSLLGTPYEINTDNNILLIEDIGEEPYRVDRLLCQLKLAGKLEALSGLIVGQFTDCQPEKEKPSLSLEDIFVEYLGELSIPIVENFPTGHARDNATLPLGVEVELDADAKALTILQNPVHI